MREGKPHRSLLLLRLAGFDLNQHATTISSNKGERCRVLPYLVRMPSLIGHIVCNVQVLTLSIVTKDIEAYIT